MQSPISRKGLTGKEIDAYLKDCNCFIGTYPRDVLPKITKFPSSFISNTDTSNQPGSHWIAIYINDGFGIYFDSFGLPPLHKEYINYLNNYCNFWCYNSLTLQNINSSTCGLYCILFLKFECNNLSLTDYQSLFLSNTKLNDILIKNYIE